MLEFLIFVLFLSFSLSSRQYLQKMRCGECTRKKRVMKYQRDPSLNFRYFRTRQLSRSTVGTVAVKEKMRYPAGYGMRRQRE